MGNDDQDFGDAHQEYAHHLDLMREKEEQDERLEDCSFAAAVAIVADYLEKKGDIPRESTLDILFTLARWSENTPSEQEMKQ